MYDANGIQSQGRIFEVGEKTGSESGKRGKGKGRKTYRCQNCGREKPIRYGEANRFCCQPCQAEFDVKRWFACSCCHASIGLGLNQSARIIGLVHATSIGKQWKMRGIVPQRPQGMLGYDPEKLRKRIETAEQRKKDRIYNGIQRDAAKLTRIIERAIKPKIFADYYSLTPEGRKERNKALHKMRKEKMRNDPKYKKQRQKQVEKWKRINSDKVKRWQKEAERKRKIIDPGFKVMCNLRHRFKEIMASCKRGKGDGFSRLTGCTTKQLAAHLSSQFKRGMTWDNYGTRWHVDHILPCASFDHTDPRQQAQCWHWTNLQPLEAKKNMAKSDTITQPQMQLLLCATH
jgi:hypothetical protein